MATKATDTVGTRMDDKQEYNGRRIRLERSRKTTTERQMSALAS